MKSCHIKEKKKKTKEKEKEREKEKDQEKTLQRGLAPKMVFDPRNRSIWAVFPRQHSPPSFDEYRQGRSREATGGAGEG